MRSSRRLCSAALGLASVVLPLALWEWASRGGHVNATLLPAPSTVWMGFWSALASGAIWVPVGYTLALVAAGYGAATALAIPLGVAMGRSQVLYNLFEPLVELIRPMPKAALVPPLFLFFGIGTTAMIVIVALVSFFPILIHTIQGVRGMDPTLVNTARTFRVPRLCFLRRFVLPSALPLILTGMRVSLGLALALAILAEMIAGENGVGFLILNLQRSFRIAEMFGWVFLLGFIGVALNAILEWLERRVTSWQGK